MEPPWGEASWGLRGVTVPFPGWAVLTGNAHSVPRRGEERERTDFSGPRDSGRLLQLANTGDPRNTRALRLDTPRRRLRKSL